MTATLQLLLAPLVGAVLVLWAAWLALAAQSQAELPRVLADQLPPESGSLSLLRALEVAHLALLVLGAAAAATAVSWWTWSVAGALVRLLLVVSLVLLIGDVLPRLLASITPDLPAATRRAAARTLVLFQPLLRLVAWADRHGRRPGAAQARNLGNAQRDMLLGLFSLADTTVAEVMTPRLDIVAVDASADRQEVITTLRSSEHARLLVYDGHQDAVVGVVYAKDMLAKLADAAEGSEPWHALIRPAAFVPEAKTLDRQLRDFQRGPGHLAVVVDEFGGTAGIITLEDILEEIVGEIQDEYDTDEVAAIQHTQDDRLAVEGGAPLSELEGVLGHSFGREDVSTVGGLILAALGRVPRPGESLDLGGFRLTVDQVVRRRVRRVQVERMKDASAPAPVSGEAR